MKDKLLEIQSTILKNIDEITDLKSLEDIRVKTLGKKGELTTILRGMKDLSKEERPVVGELANKIREKIEISINEKRENLQEEKQLSNFKKERLDITLPGKKRKIGNIHPIYQTIQSLEDIFISMGFDIVDGPEIETVENNFDALNAPKDHPSRDKTDTFYIDENHVLRTQTSPVQIRAMKNNQPPIRIVSPGRCFRKDELDATHSPMFHQLEGLVIDKGINFTNLKGTLEMFVKRYFGDNTKTKFRPHHFPFTEPSAEMDISCFKCNGIGCSLCKGSGWIEILGAGMVHPNVLENCGIDSEIYSGFAFGLGLDRVTMNKYDIEDIRMFFENDLRFIEQFK